MATKSQSKRRQHADAARTDTVSREQFHGSPELETETRSLPKAPHERDESARPAGSRRDERVLPAGREIEQAHTDIENGLTDTDRRGVPDDTPSSRDNRAR